LQGGPRAAFIFSEPVEGTLHALPAPVQDMGIAHRRLHILVAEQFLNGADVVAGLEQVSGEGMPQLEG